MKPFTTVSALAWTAFAHFALANGAHLSGANHIFNALHSSMRQFGSSLNHNGMSVFIATVPEDTELYHGTSNPYRVNGTEWLAFEPEHALIFARGRRGPPGRGGEPPDGGPPDGEPPPRPDSRETDYRGGRSGSHHIDSGVIHHSPPPPSDPRKDLKRHEIKQSPLDLVADEKPSLSGEAKEVHGYLHTYRTRNVLRLLYVDGQSAAKSDKGTLDVQDLVLLHHNPPSSNYPPGHGSAHEESRHSTGDERPAPPHHGPMGEMERAEGMCRLAREEYEGRIDGILRMEGGFEIILCDIAKDLEVVRITQASASSMGPGGPGRDSGDGFNYYQAVAARYDGIGGGRVTIDYDHFVTMYAFPDAVHFDESGRPRVNNETATITPVRAAIREMAISHSKPQSTDWQAIADMVIARYADRIAFLATASEFKDLETFKAEVDRAMRPFVDYGHRNHTAEIARCASQFLPTAFNLSPLAPAAILEVTGLLCRTLSAASEADTLAHGLSTMRALKSWLGWTTWKRCRGCGPHEVCFLPIWPMGSEQDFDQPQCRSDISQAERSYWGGFGRPPRDGKDRPVAGHA